MATPLLMNDDISLSFLCRKGKLCNFPKTANTVSPPPCLFVNACKQILDPICQSVGNYIPRNVGLLCTVVPGTFL